MAAALLGVGHKTMRLGSGKDLVLVFFLLELHGFSGLKLVVDVDSADTLQDSTQSKGN